MPKYIPNKTAEIEEVQNLEIKRLTKALALIQVVVKGIEWGYVGKCKRIEQIAKEALNPKQKGT